MFNVEADGFQLKVACVCLTHIGLVVVLEFVEYGLVGQS